MTNFQKALDKMPERFTSHAYLRELRDMGVPEKVIEDDEHVRFLKKNCLQESVKRWNKNPPVEKNGQIILPFPDIKVTNLEEKLIKEYIDFLKERGYRIFKSVEV